ncbi:hypothetical protein KSF78_0009287 [Schistosoma japonicum]|nr:hypothetical protein KSF78_0009287 [Schistosoma japonicum]
MKVYKGIVVLTID